MVAVLRYGEPAVAGRRDEPRPLRIGRDDFHREEAVEVVHRLHVRRPAARQRAGRPGPHGCGPGRVRLEYRVGIGDRRIGAAAGLPRHVIDVVGGRPRVWLECNVAGCVLHPQSQRVGDGRIRGGVHHHDRLGCGIRIVAPPGNRHEHRGVLTGLAFGHAVEDHHGPVVAPGQALRAGLEMRRPVARFEQNAFDDVGDGRRAMELGGLRRRGSRDDERRRHRDSKSDGDQSRTSIEP